MGVRRWEENKPTPSSQSAARPAAPGPLLHEGETPVPAEPELAPREDALCRRLRGSRAQFLSGTSEKPRGSDRESRPCAERRRLPVGPAHACSGRLGRCGLRAARRPRARAPPARRGRSGMPRGPAHACSGQRGGAGSGWPGDPTHARFRRERDQ